jgi:hypothetical protein
MDLKLKNNVENRQRLVDELRRELVGPAAEFETLGRDYPRGRYGVGVLYPVSYVTGQVPSVSGTEVAPVLSEDEAGPADSNSPSPNVETLGNGTYTVEAAEDDEAAENDGVDFDLTLANARLPASMALSTLIQLPPDSRLRIIVTGGRYEQVHLAKPDADVVSATLEQENIPQVENPSDKPAEGAAEPTADAKSETAAPAARPTWQRVPVQPEAIFIDAAEIIGGGSTHVVTSASINSGPLRLELHVLTRPHVAGNTTRLLTISLINRSSLPAKGNAVDAYCLFQSAFIVDVMGKDDELLPAILSYPAVERDGGVANTVNSKLAVEEEGSLALLYREQRTYAIGHGCAADWVSVSQTTASSVRAEVLPVTEVAGLTPDIKSRAKKADGTLPVISVPMAPLAGLIKGNDGIKSVQAVISQYKDWITEQKTARGKLSVEFHSAADRHIEQASACALRMEEGLKFLESSADAQFAFRLANEAVLLQQLRGSSKAREIEADGRRPTLGFKEAAPTPDLTAMQPGRGNWRPFQIAFIVMNLRSSVIGEDKYRENVELIWFPTGGGKTEAYLGLTAFAIFYQYLTRQEGTQLGTLVLMRYTLRLLTAQQFQRASRLFCSMEYLRATSTDERLSKVGTQRISIGLWLGSGTTPNKNEDAVAALRKLNDPGNETQRNPLLITQCPWCNARMGPIRPTLRNVPRVVGYRNNGSRVSFVCPDNSCYFGKEVRPLPVFVTDEDIYAYRPTLVIGTVDKFARLASVPQARALFGRDGTGEQVSAPPSLIIQDELHLIAGPLGSIVGLYEGLIEELCTDRRDGGKVRPKIVSSTATIRRYQSQIKALYGRDSVTLFPPPGLTNTDSFFSAPDTDEYGKPLPGRLYLGVHAPGLQSIQTTQVRTFSALLYSAQQLPDGEKDPWWTLLLFYNSLRELGGAITLFQSDIVEYLKGLGRRLAPAGQLPRHRYVNKILELTGRIASDEVVQFIDRLERKFGEQPSPIDACLASNIIEVGVDIDRLSLIGVVGQPKTTAQYIQVTGRVGRKANERPGLVVTLFSTSRPRDRSHYEQFRSYHQRLYAQVEPTSLTPFSPPAIDRALHGLLIAWVRQTLPSGTVPSDTHEIKAALDSFFNMVLLPRIRAVAPEFETTLQQIFEMRRREWLTWQPEVWENKGKGEDLQIGLTYPAGEVAVEHGDRQWPLLGSMRNVDATSELRIESLRAIKPTV